MAVTRPAALPASDTRAPPRRGRAPRTPPRQARRSCERLERRARARDPRAGDDRRRWTAAPTRARFVAERHLNTATRVEDAVPYHRGRPRPAAPRARPRAAEASRRRDRIDRGARAKASLDTPESLCAVARTLERRISARAARAHVHRPDELEPSREDCVPTDTSNRDNAVLERLAQRLEHRAWELRQLVHEEDAPVRQRYLSRTRGRPSAHDRRRRRSVVGSSKWGYRDERAARRQQAGDRVDASHLERLLARRASAGCRETTGEHRLARARADPSAGGCASRRQRSRAHGAPAPVRADRRGPDRRRPRSRSRRSARTAEHRSPRESTRRPRGDAGPATGSIPASAASGADSAAQTSRFSPGATRALRDGERSRHRADAAVERELADGGVLGESLRWKLPRRSEHSERDRKVEPRALLPECGGREVDRDPPVERPLERRPRRRRCERGASPPGTRGRRARRSRTPGSPGWRCASTSTLRGSRPTRAWVIAVRALAPR